MDQQGKNGVLCECGAWVNFGDGGQANLATHLKGKRHATKMKEKEDLATNRVLTDFFSYTTKQKVGGAIPAPLPIANNALFDFTIPSDPSASIMTRLRQSITRLPPTVPKATPEHPLARFFSLPQVNPSSGDQWEVVNPILNRLIGVDIGMTEMKTLICVGPYGLDALCNWLDAYLSANCIQEALLEPKINRLIDVMTTFIIYESSSNNGAEETLTEIQTQSSDIPPGPVALSTRQEITNADNLPELTPESTTLVPISTSSESEAPGADNDIECYDDDYAHKAHVSSGDLVAVER